jgi:hypothetical protein
MNAKEMYFINNFLRIDIFVVYDEIHQAQLSFFGHRFATSKVLITNLK